MKFLKVVLLSLSLFFLTHCGTDATSKPLTFSTLVGTWEADCWHNNTMDLKFSGSDKFEFTRKEYEAGDDDCQRGFTSYKGSGTLKLTNYIKLDGANLRAAEIEYEFTSYEKKEATESGFIPDTSSFQRFLSKDRKTEALIVTLNDDGKHQIHDRYLKVNPASPTGEKAAYGDLYLKKK